MPVVTWTGTGVIPLAQWVFLPPITGLIVKWMFLGWLAAAEAMIRNGEALGFVRTLFRHCKPMLVLGESAQVLSKAGIDPKASFPGVHVVAQGGDGTADLIASMIRHRDFERETDPPMV